MPFERRVFRSPAAAAEILDVAWVLGELRRLRLSVRLKRSATQVSLQRALSRKAVTAALGFSPFIIASCPLRHLQRMQRGQQFLIETIDFLIHVGRVILVELVDGEMQILERNLGASGTVFRGTNTDVGTVAVSLRTALRRERAKTRSKPLSM